MAPKTYTRPRADSDFPEEVADTFTSDAPDFWPSDRSPEEWADDGDQGDFREAPAR